MLQHYYLVDISTQEFEAMPVESHWVTALSDTNNFFLGIMVVVFYTSEVEAITKYEEILNQMRKGVDIKLSPASNVQSKVVAIRYNEKEAPESIVFYVVDKVEFVRVPKED